MRVHTVEQSEVFISVFLFLNFLHEIFFRSYLLYMHIVSNYKNTAIASLKKKRTFSCTPRARSVFSSLTTLQSHKFPDSITCKTRILQ